MYDILTTPPKFKILKTGEILDVTRIDHATGTIIGSDGTQYSEGEYELKPFTGKIDRNGEKIYYGDFLTDEGFFGHDYPDYGEVVWDKVDREYCISWDMESITETINCSEEYVLSNPPCYHDFEKEDE